MDEVKKHPREYVDRVLGGETVVVFEKIVPWLRCGRSCSVSGSVRSAWRRVISSCLTISRSVAGRRPSAIRRRMRLLLDRSRTFQRGGNPQSLTGSLEWPVADFRARRGHFLVFVWYPAASHPNTAPRVYIVASEELRRYLAEHGHDRLSLEHLDQEVHVREAWERLAFSPAA